jgi:hypothetical protein
MEGCTGATVQKFDGATGGVKEVGVVVPVVPSEFSGAKESTEGDGEGGPEIDVVVEVGVEGSEDGEEEGALDFSSFSDWLCTEYTKGAAEYSIDSGIVKDRGGEAIFDVDVFDPDEVRFGCLRFGAPRFDEFSDPFGQAVKRSGEGVAAVEAGVSFVGIPRGSV